MIDSTTPLGGFDRSRRRPALAAVLLVLVLALGPAAADAGVSYQKGKYSGKTTQSAVGSSFRKIKFTVKKGKIILTTEPAVARGLCVSAPVFTIDGPSTKKISRRGKFTFTKTFVGSKFDKITGAFVSPTEIDGFAIYHFQSQDLCSGGKTRVRYTATRGRK